MTDTSLVSPAYIIALEKAEAVARAGQTDVVIFREDAATISINSTGEITIVVLNRYQDLFQAFAEVAITRCPSHSITESYPTFGNPFITYRPI